MFDQYLSRWNLTSDGEPITTRSAALLPVLRYGEPAILKLYNDEHQQRGADLMAWWGGDGAARVFAKDNSALLMERAQNSSSLAQLTYAGQDDEACYILCETAARLHAVRRRPLPELVELTDWFRELEPAADKYGGILTRCAKIARTILAEPRDRVVLHGDLHHDNVLNFGDRGWLAIDPHGLVGERGFDFANIFTNPDLSDPSRPVATEPGRFLLRLSIVVERSQLERQRLLHWILAWTGLSAAWFLNDDDPLASIDLRIAELAAAELDR